MNLRVRSWSPSRFAKHKECPAKVKYEDLLKTCPVCFKGKITGGFNGEPVVCDACTKPQPEREALDRGNRLDAALTYHLGTKTTDRTLPEEHRESLAEAVRHPKIEDLVKKLRRLKQGVFHQFRICINRHWERREEDPDKGVFARDAWGRVVLDVLRITKQVAEVIDWKSGNIDKKTGQIRERADYHDSMRLYQLTVMATHPQIREVTARMAFLDAPPKLENPFKVLAPLKRADFEIEKGKMESKLEVMMHDEIFPARPGFYCRWCPFSKMHNEGPCTNG
jgi:hypothetical protein